VEQLGAVVADLALLAAAAAREEEAAEGQGPLAPKLSKLPLRLAVVSMLAVAAAAAAAGGGLLAVAAGVVLHWSRNVLLHPATVCVILRTPSPG
jgi:hypothetical protein